MTDQDRNSQIEERMKSRSPQDDDCASRSVKAVLFLIAVAMVILSLAHVPQAKADSGQGLVAKQHRFDACLLGAVATHLNYQAGERLYTSQSMALAYHARYGADDWGKDGTTSYQAQTLVSFAGYRFIWGKMPAAWFLADTIRQGHYPLIFLGGVWQHAIVAVSIDENGLVVYADPNEGTLLAKPLEQLWLELEPYKWFSYGERA